MVTPLRVWLLSDGVPGHTNQALGLLRRIAVLKTVDCQEYEVVLGFRLPVSYTHLTLPTI